jgi:7,8-dihydropterin-6-yl-methyl-4-(beta-D-ribofuranosyl)aminobenzene 5'-phosphate synthase
MIKITTVYDNNLDQSEFQDDWGFSCVVQHPNGNVIFDTGAKPAILKSNLKKLHIDPQSIQYLVISHKHWDHKGGALWLLEQNPNIIVYMPKTWSNNLEKSLPTNSEHIHSIKNHGPINDTFHLILSKNLWINELALGIKTSNGIIAITGCSHTGILKIAKTMHFVTKEKIHALFGGFHLMRSSKSRIKNTVTGLKDENINFIAPCHCTGDIALSLFKEEFGDKFLRNGIGSQYLFDV